MFGPMRERIIVIFPVEGFKGGGRIRASKPCGGFHSGTEDLLTLPLQWGKGVGEGEKVRRKEGRTIRSQQSGTNHSSRSAGRFYFPWTGRRELTTNPDQILH